MIAKDSGFESQACRIFTCLQPKQSLKDLRRSLALTVNVYYSAVDTSRLKDNGSKAINVH